ncbi:type II toxin-antitoxin system RelE/ParE family toxin [Sphingomonas sp.]|uniref:type II toxin-antitoxin system RelE/ParE family toxin n=1 Tax=Sphingomonas sp. TaxID=28214 RepID=UPI001B0C3CD8|nr:type II toxin-antitoxin system RelE/ParE family toxin [Sphingomonas sp.]MBO9711467.1 type II toxin-antitoxin system RelE/ParE family toxin [Sphingomonas sp.]
MVVEWSIEARMDLVRIFDFNAANSERYAHRVDRRLAERASALASTPFIGRQLGAGAIRALSVPDIQYVITYRVEPGRVLVTRVKSTRERK